jgi:hypothetical protein
MQFVSYDGVSFAGQGIKIRGAEGLFQRTQQGIYVAGAQTLPSFAGVQFDTVVIPTFIYFSGDEWSTIQSKLRTLDRILRWDLKIQRTLVATLDDDTQIEILAIPKSLQENGWYRYELLWEVVDYWESSTATTVSVTGPAVAGDDLTADVTLSGTVRTLPQVTLTPLLPKTSGTTVQGFATTVTEQAGDDLAAVAWTISFDHASQVAAGASLSDGSDIRVYLNGVEVKRSLSGTNTATCAVCFPLTVAASGTATVLITYAGAGQTYSLGAYAQTGVHQVVTEQSGNALSVYPYSVVVDHASQVTAGLSKSSGADIRVLLDGTEVDRKVVNANSATTRVWFPLAIPANGSVVVDVQFSSSGYDFSGTIYSNGSMDLSASTNSDWIYTTPGFANNDDTPGKIKPILLTIAAGQSNPTNYQVITKAGTDPGLQAEIMDTAAFPSRNGNYMRWYAGGVEIASLSYAANYRNGVSSARSAFKIGSSPDLSNWTAEETFPQEVVIGGQTVGYLTTSVAAGSIAVVAGIERTSATQDTGNAEDNYVKIMGSGSSEITLTLESSSAPAAASLTDPSNVTGSNFVQYTFAGTLSDELGHSIAVSNITAPDGGALVIDAATKTAWLLDSDGNEIANSASTARRGLSPDGNDEDWLACEPNDTTTITWSEANMDADGMQLDIEVADQWR